MGQKLSNSCVGCVFLAGVYQIHWGLGLQFRLRGSWYLTVCLGDRGVPLKRSAGLGWTYRAPQIPNEGQIALDLSVCATLIYLCKDVDADMSCIQSRIG